MHILLVEIYIHICVRTHTHIHHKHTCVHAHIHKHTHMLAHTDTHTAGEQVKALSLTHWGTACQHGLVVDTPAQSSVQV